MVAYCFSVAHCGSGSLPKRVVVHVLERTKLEVSPGKIGVLSALLGELHLPFGVKASAMMHGYPIKTRFYVVRRQSVLLSALPPSDRMWAPKVSRRSCETVDEF